MTGEGIFPHPDFSGRITGFVDFIYQREQPYDDNGHGTHVAGILAGDGTVSRGKYKGVAPGCNLIGVKVLDKQGNGKKEDVLHAFQWILSNRENYRIRIVNISVGTTCNLPEDHEALIEGVERLWDEGLVVVAAAGNRGPVAGSITAPGSSKKVITVGACDMLQGNQGISGRGPTMDCVIKPDIVTYGERIVSCSPRGNGYAVKSGTSMSTPHISGAIALLLEKHPELTNYEIKIRLLQSAQDMGLPHNLQGWGKFSMRAFLQEKPVLKQAGKFGASNRF